MIMASAPGLEELLTCPICQDIFDNPMVLKCHHTLCSGCLAALKRASAIPWKVDCPVCRQPTRAAEIQKDFRTISLLEAQKQAEKTPVKQSDSDNTARKETVSTLDATISIKMCELCNKEPVNSRCKQCSRIICGTCSNTHKSIPACKNHTIQSLDNLVGQHKIKLSQSGESLRNLEGKVAAKNQQLQLYQHSMDELENQTLDVIAQWFEDMVESISYHRDILNERVSKAISADKADMQKVQANVTGIQNNIRASMNKIDDLLEENDTAKVLASTDNIVKALKSGVLKVDPSKFTTPKLLDMNITVGKKWDSSTGLDVQIRRSSSSKQANLWTTFPPAVDTKTYTNTLEVVVENGGKQLLFHAGYLWCLYHNRIDIHNKEGTWIDSITDHLDNPNGIAPMPSGHMLVACLGSGLIQMNTGGSFMCVVAEGSYCDTSADTQFVYGLDYTGNTPCIKLFQRGFFKWNVIREIPLQYDNCNPCNTILSNGMHMFTGVASHSCIYRYHSSGTILEKYEWSGSPGTQEHRPPRLCCADSKGQVLVTHFLQNSVWILTKDNMWKDLNTPGLDKPYGAAFDDEGALWVVNLTNKLIKYV